MKRFIKVLFVVASVAFLMPLFASGDPVAVTVAGLTGAAVVVNLVTPYVNNGIFAMTNFDARMVYENSKDALVKAFNGNQRILEVCKLTQGTLRFEVPLVAGQTLYTFNVLDNQALNFITEDRLKLQDSFVISSIFVGTAAPSSAADNTFLPDTYANTQKYGANGPALQAWWNAGNLQLSVNNDILVPKWDLFRHYNAAETQQTAALGAASPMDQDRGAFDGFYPCEPNIVMIGQKDTQLQVILKGAGLATVQAFSRGVIIVRGVLAQNSTVVS